MRLRKNKRGVTLVEVIIAFALMLLFIAVFAGSISFSGAMGRKAGEIRADATEAAELLREQEAAGTTAQEEGSATYKFTVVGGAGINVLFQMDTKLVSRTVTLEDGTTRVFYQFAADGDAEETP